MIVGGMSSCGPTEETKEGTPIGLTEAKGHYLEGDKKYKIWYGGIFRINEVENFKNLYPHSSNRCYFQSHRISNLSRVF